MKKYFKILTLLFGVLMITLSSCEKDQEMVVANGDANPTFTTSATELTLSQSESADTVITFSWPAVDFGYDAVVNYSIQFGIKGQDFAKSEIVSAGSALKLDMTAAQLNALIGRLDETALDGNTFNLDTRLVARIGTTYGSTSQVSDLKVTTYSDDIIYPSLWVPGDYQGWVPENAPRVSTGQATDNKIYSGYIFIEKTTGSPFKFTSIAGWSGSNYGGTSTQSATGASGDLSTSGGDLNIAKGGYYKLDADLNTNKWKALKTDWGIIGDATPGSWDNSTPMTYNPATKVWTITTNLAAGKEMKFRANNSWDLNYGAVSKDVNTLLSGKLKEGGENIKITDGGSYTITLNLSVTGNYKYKIVKN